MKTLTHCRVEDGIDQLMIEVEVPNQPVVVLCRGYRQIIFLEESHHAKVSLHNNPYSVCFTS